MFHSRGAWKLQKNENQFRDSCGQPIPSQLKLKHVIINSNVSHTKPVAVYGQAFHTEAENGDHEQRRHLFGDEGGEETVQNLEEREHQLPIHCLHDLFHALSQELDGGLKMTGRENIVTG